jgi:hypothetical protein
MKIVCECISYEVLEINKIDVMSMCVYDEGGSMHRVNESPECTWQRVRLYLYTVFFL